MSIAAAPTSSCPNSTLHTKLKRTSLSQLPEIGNSAFYRNPPEENLKKQQIISSWNRDRSCVFDVKDDHQPRPRQGLPFLRKRWQTQDRSTPWSFPVKLNTYCTALFCTQSRISTNSLVRNSAESSVLLIMRLCLRREHSCKLNPKCGLGWESEAQSWQARGSLEGFIDLIMSRVRSFVGCYNDKLVVKNRPPYKQLLVRCATISTLQRCVVPLYKIVE
jgi:hypothetical protein